MSTKHEADVGELAADAPVLGDVDVVVVVPVVVVPVLVVLEVGSMVESVMVGCSASGVGTGRRRQSSGSGRSSVEPAAARLSSHAWRMTAAATLSTTLRRAAASRSISMQDAVGGHRAQPLIVGFDGQVGGGTQLRDLGERPLGRRSDRAVERQRAGPTTMASTSASAASSRMRRWSRRRSPERATTS